MEKHGKRWQKDGEKMAKDMIDPTNWSQNDVQRFCFNQEWKRKKHRYGIDIDPYMMMVGWSSGGERKRFVIGFKTMQFLGFTRFGYICIEA